MFGCKSVYNMFPSQMMYEIRRISPRLSKMEKTWIDVHVRFMERVLSSAIVFNIVRHDYKGTVIKYVNNDIKMPHLYDIESSESVCRLITHIHINRLSDIKNSYRFLVSYKEYRVGQYYDPPLPGNVKILEEKSYDISPRELYTGEVVLNRRQLYQFIRMIDITTLWLKTSVD